MYLRVARGVILLLVSPSQIHTWCVKNKRRDTDRRPWGWCGEISYLQLRRAARQLRLKLIARMVYTRLLPHAIHTRFFFFCCCCCAATSFCCSWGCVMPCCSHHKRMNAHTVRSPRYALTNNDERTNERRLLRSLTRTRV